LVLGRPVHTVCAAEGIVVLGVNLVVLDRLHFEVQRLDIYAKARQITVHKKKVWDLHSITGAHIERTSRNAEQEKRAMATCESTCDRVFSGNWLPPTDLQVEFNWQTSKRCLDIALTTLLLFIAGPIILLAALLIKLTSRGPVLYRQTRLGLRGRPFTILKLRTMVPNRPKQAGASWSDPRDSRITALGRVLRALKIDELPQLWNVLRGDMSLVGPRPEWTEFVAGLQDAVPGYNERVQVLPGLSGLAQVQLPPPTDLESVRRKVECDLYYVKNGSLGLDLKILAATPLYILRVPPALIRQLLGLPGIEPAYSRLDAFGPAELVAATSANAG
jgi:lipopolysaccharide/colanic/teichoic acid biosynthesis glycosyltransferase